MKLSRNKIDHFWRKRAGINNPRIATHFKQDDTHVFDLRLIRRYCTPQSEVLDVACGTCYLANELVNDVAFIKGTDKFAEFLKNCQISDKLEVEQADIITYTDNRKYDIILMFGIIMYFSDQDTRKIYQKYYNLLKPGGKLIVKHQCGIAKDVFIDKYSEQIQDYYQACYKSVRKDESMLQEFFQNVKVVDIYPARLNPWPDTHFFAFVCHS